MTRLTEHLDRHRDAMSQCRRCGHGAGVQPIVSMARAPKVMLVGQAPGKTEMSGGKPFAGRAGRTLFGWLASVGIDEPAARSRMYIAAVTRCYPGPSPSGRGDRVPSPAERANCADWLASELRIIRPRLIVPVGRLAIDALIGPASLDEIVGREHDVVHDGRRAVAVPLPHPSGASSWVHDPAHRRLLDRALASIGAHWRRIYPTRRAA
jgi:uracil-DNA glycosylase